MCRYTSSRIQALPAAVDRRICFHFFTFFVYLELLVLCVSMVRAKRPGGSERRTEEQAGGEGAVLTPLCLLWT